MKLNVIDFLYEKLLKLTSFKSLTNTYGITRSLLALGSLATISFNSIPVMFPLKEKYNSVSSSNVFINEYSIFNLLSGNLYFAKLICVLILLLVLIGYRPRLTGILHWWISASIFISIQIPDGGDQITSIITFLLIPLTLSDNRKWHWHKKQEIKSTYLSLILFSFYSVMKLQICILYFQAGVEKLNTLEWKKGTVIYYWLNHHIFGMNDFFKPLIQPILENIYSITFITWSVIVLELLLFSSIVAKNKFKKGIFFVAIIFHFFIFLFHGLFSFFIAMSSCLIIYLLPLEKEMNLKKYFLKFYHLISKLVTNNAN